MLPSEKRLKRKDFSSFSRHTSQTYNHLGVISYTPLSSFRAAVVTSGKHQKSAVLRNRLRRRVYTIIGRHPLSTFQVGMILYASKKSYTFSYEQLEMYLYSLLEMVQKNSK